MAWDRLPLPGFASGQSARVPSKGRCKERLPRLFSGVGDIISENFPYLDTATGKHNQFSPTMQVAVALHGVVGC